MTDFDAPTKDDLERTIKDLAKDALFELKMARNKITGEMVGRGMAQSSAHIQQVALEVDKRFREVLSKALELAISFVGPVGSATEVAAILEPILEQFGKEALGEIPNPSGMRERVSGHYQDEFDARLKSALRSFAIGQINGKRIDYAGKARPLHKVNDTDYVDEVRLQELRAITHQDFDLRRLIRICEELNSSWQLGNYFAVPGLVRTIMDHIPPIFGGKNFAHAKANHGDRTFKDHMERLDDSLRLIADASLHRHIRKSETLPTASQVNFAADLDVLLGEVIAKLARS